MKNEFIEYDHGFKPRLQKYRGMCMNRILRRGAGIAESLFPERFSSDNLTRPDHEKDSGTDPEKPKFKMSSDSRLLAGIPPEKLLSYIHKV